MLLSPSSISISIENISYLQQYQVAALWQQDVLLIVMMEHFWEQLCGLYWQHCSLDQVLELERWRADYKLRKWCLVWRPCLSAHMPSTVFCCQFFMMFGKEVIWKNLSKKHKSCWWQPYCTVHTSWPIWMKDGVGDLHIIPQGKYSWYGDACIKSHILL